MAAIETITIADADQLSDYWFETKIRDELNDVGIELVDPSIKEGEYGIVEMDLYAL